ncbi:metalloregulator ArsR/SmtB family transcription factor [Paenibacillus crassostreae]|uniref:ArsR family transcriptional regulator n=1 Tax=Paenibacillus crassostreae TaxID=1763538 RepID=A0A167G2W1_9BACL|nr:metalloregulator ArsR/SmtB family transcription factor [Paenibacillus crassostreae]AOZ93814.1 ArsR family transcriptional regulator [Paenibacillus crassostreae]OAB77153.1 ArsR family transcriptional regulator [Paenibacillus crassostreae]
MQLDKLVNYHKALADPTRIKILIILAEGECNGQILAEKLCVTPATITHHANKLREASLINERRDKNTIYFTLNEYFIHNNATAILDVIYRNVAKEGAWDDMDDTHKKLQDSVVRNFITPEGKLKQIPAQLKKKLIILEHLVSQLESGRKYTEQEINQFIKLFHEDFATIRREFIMHQFMYRENEIYELNPRELWARWDIL